MFLGSIRFLSFLERNSNSNILGGNFLEILEKAEKQNEL